MRKAQFFLSLLLTSFLVSVSGLQATNAQAAQVLTVEGVEFTWADHVYAPQSLEESTNSFLEVSYVNKSGSDFYYIGYSMNEPSGAVFPVFSIKLGVKNASTGKLSGKMSFMYFLNFSGPGKYPITLCTKRSLETAEICGKSFVSFVNTKAPASNTLVPLSEIDRAAEAAVTEATAAITATAFAREACDAVSSTETDLKKISIQIAKIETAYKSATTALVNVTTANDNARAQLVKFQALMNAATVASEKQALATALSKLATAALTLSRSKANLAAQVDILIAKKASLLDAEKKLSPKLPASSASPSTAKAVVTEKVIVCLKGNSFLKVVGKDPKCPLGYKKKA